MFFPKAKIKNESEVTANRFERVSVNYHCTIGQLSSSGWLDYWEKRERGGFFVVDVPRMDYGLSREEIQMSG